MVLGGRRTRLKVDAMIGTSGGDRGGFIEGGTVCRVQETMKGLLIGGGQGCGGEERVWLGVQGRRRWIFRDLSDVASEELDVVAMLGNELVHSLGCDEVDLYGR
jgi:hypothetical protein